MTLVRRFLPTSIPVSDKFIHAGTDATIAQHIETIVSREYVIERMEGKTKYLVPSSLGIGLIEGYDKIEFEKSLSKPQLRREVNTIQVVVAIYHN